MAAENSSNTGRKNYYGVSYGKLSTRVKDVPDGYTEITEAELKSKTQEVVQIDLRNKYIDKAKGDYPNVVFYDSITGHITAQEKFENDNGTNLNITIIDKDGDESILQLKFYSKYAENLLNRFLNASDLSKQMVFFPYAIPNTAEIQGETKRFYTSGVSLKIDGTKVDVKYLDKSKDAESLLPNTEQIKVAGKMTTSRDERIDFLYTEFVKAFQNTNLTAQPKAAPATTATAAPKQEAQAVANVTSNTTTDEPASIGKANEPNDLPF